MNLRAIRVLGLGCVVCLLALPLAGSPNGASRISGVVVDPAGTPQMGAAVVVSSERLNSGSPLELRTNDRGRFATAPLPVGLYSVRVTLAGYLPAMEQHVEVDAEHGTLLQIVLGTVFSSFEKMRRGADQPVNADDWTWVLRSSAATRPVLRWQDDSAANGSGGLTYSSDTSGAQKLRARLELQSGADHPGSIGALSDSPGTAFAYDLGLGGEARLVMAGEYSEEDGASAGSIAAEWLPTGTIGAGPITTVLVRESRLGPAGPMFRGMRLSHEDALAVGDKLSVRYGADLVVAGFNGTTTSLRPRAELAWQLSPAWQISAFAATHPWQEPSRSADSLQSALDTLDAYPTLLIRGGRPVLADGLHEELAIDHALNARAELIASVFHDLSSHTAVIGRGGMGSPDFLQDYFSDAFAYDGGSTSSAGARLVFRDKITNNLTTTVVYAYAGALAPNGVVSGDLREELATRYRQSAAAALTTTVPRLRTKLTTSYKWLSGPAVSRQDPYGESLYHIDPYLSLEIRQPVPYVFSGRMEVQADMGNLLAQGYVPISTSDGSVVLVPSYRYFRGGLSLQF
ncbi:MAG TPA: carboxypeptidase-like regulatory domain-containing protein [Candidatus Acidoferrales bacterium]|nr:carboxypeptidase-like regulatory domain-containing protein [Candidatus Acidoferrales bacterium]